MNHLKRNGTQLRNAELAQIHLAKKQLGLDDDIYRDVLFTVARVKSSKDLDWAGRKQVLDHFKTKGWKPAPPRQAKADKPVSKGQEGLVRLLWSQLHADGKVHDASDTALGNWLARHNWPVQMAWLSSDQLNQAIEELKKWQMR